jgi:phenylalanyl-tRNA synthetase beta chain
MVERLRRSGMRSINPIVDVTNYVMHELGQPMHAFDMDRIDGGIRVRMASKGEKLKLLDGSNVSLNSGHLVIADHKRAIALAGIMGGEKSAISTRTTNIYLEAAFFSPQGILGKAREIGMHTDASHRFERGVDYSLQARAMERATQLVLEIAGGEPGPVTDVVDKGALPRRASIRFHQSEITRILGIPVAANKVTRILKDLGMTVKRGDREWRVRPPSWRFDISGQHDLVEEVGRCFGFDNVPPTMPAAIQKAGAHPENHITEYAIKTRMTSLGYHEAITYSFVDPQLHSELVGSNNAIRLANPIADNMSVMRQSLWPGLLEALRSNLNRQETRVRLFETGHIFNRARNSRKSSETNMLAGIACGSLLPRQWGAGDHSVDFFDVKGDIESILVLTGNSGQFSFKPAVHPALHPGQSAQIMCGKKTVGFVGKLNPSKQDKLDIDAQVFLFEINMEFLQQRCLPSFSEISRYPSVQRDLALVVDEGVAVESVLALARSCAGEYLRNLELFDVYKGENIEKNKKSLAFSLTFQSESSNLTSLEVDAITDKIIEAVEREIGAQLRN